MDKSALLLHGFHSSSESYFFPNLKKVLSMDGYEVIAPDMPNPTTPIIEEWISCIKESLKDKRDINLVIAHSLGGTLALNLLSQDLISVDNLYLIGSSFGPEREVHLNNFRSSILDLDTINKNAKNIWAITSYDDPWTCSEYTNLFVKQFDAVGIFFNKLGHFECQELPPKLMKIIRLQG